jgi:hypothetical protein
MPRKKVVAISGPPFPTDTCARCTFFKVAEGGDAGVCFGMPPQLLNDGPTVMRFRPMVDPTDSVCSIFKPVLNG